MFSCEQYIEKLQQANLIIAKCINETATKTMVQIMIGDIRVQGNMMIAMAKIHIISNIMSYWIGTISYMSTRVTMTLPPQSGLNIKSNDGYNGRTMSIRYQKWLRWSWMPWHWPWWQKSKRRTKRTRWKRGSWKWYICTHP